MIQNVVNSIVGELYLTLFSLCTKSNKRGLKYLRSEMDRTKRDALTESPKALGRSYQRSFHSGKEYHTPHPLQLLQLDDEPYLQIRHVTSRRHAWCCSLWGERFAFPVTTSSSSASPFHVPYCHYRTEFQIHAIQISVHFVYVRFPCRLFYDVKEQQQEQKNRKRKDKVL